jgi:aminoglycoside phosphotransferase (APT) family kinase protein
VSLVHDLAPEGIHGYESEVREVLARHFGSPPVRLRHNWFGHTNVVFSASVGDQNIILRANRDTDTFGSTVHNIEVIRGLGIPAPEVLFSDLTMTQTSFAYVITREIPGRDLRFELPTMSQGQQRTVANQVMGYQRRVAVLPKGRGYGYVGIGEKGPHQSWTAVLDDNQRPDRQTGTLHDRLCRAMDSIAAYLDAVPSVCFLDDLTTKNVIIDAGILQGVIDFDAVCYGDPLFHMGLAQTAVTFDLPASCLTYVDHLCEAGDIRGDRRRIVDIYSAHCGLDFLARITDSTEYAAGVDRVAEWLTRASG